MTWANREHGVVHYKDLYKLNLNDYSLEKKVGYAGEPCDEVAASTLIVDEVEKGEHAKGLFFSSGRFLSSGFERFKFGEWTRNCFR